MNRRRRGIFLLPNLLTTAALFAGFYAIIAAISAAPEDAAVAIFVAMLLDGFDGRVARLTQTESDFGKEYDSLADMVSFGVAPALVVYLWGLSELADQGWYWSELGWLLSFLYVAGAALRLARFNSMPGVRRRRYFQGLPSPSAAATVAGFVWLATTLELQGFAAALAGLVVTGMAGALMVSNVSYYSFKDVKLAERVPFRYILLVVLGFVLIALNPPVMLFLLFFVYLLSGVLLALYRAARLHRGRPIF